MRTVAMLMLGFVIGEPRPADLAAPPSFSDEQRGHWAYRVPASVEPPRPADASWVRGDIDRFILAGLEELDFTPAPEADAVTLIRRVTFDLTGLPPTPEEVERFVADRRPDAYERLVDDLLERPQYGERWAQHWLDLAHYADSNGFELDADRPDAWRYRDWVIRALNDDLPYDQFVKLQIAGDELRPGDPDALVATGFGRCGPREVVGGNIDPRERRQSELTEVTGTVGSVFLGLTMACARCHDHKFDAIPTADYYRLQSFFAGAEFVDRRIADAGAVKRYEAAQEAVAARAKPLKEAQATLEAPYRARIKEAHEATLTEAERAILAKPKEQRTPQEEKLAAGLGTALTVRWEEVAAAVAANPTDHAERERLRREIYEIERSIGPPPAHAMALAEEKAEAPETFVLGRGDVKSPGAKVEPRPLGVILANQSEGSFEAPTPRGAHSGRRSALAAWLVRPENPLPARVIVNRLWQHHFGRGLVATPSDFGVRGEAPSHPELLDWLANGLVRSGWRLKPMQRLMVTSAAYRQCSSPRFSVVADDPTACAEWVTTFASRAEDDPDNLLVWRQNRRRLDAEAIRDAMLAASGELNPAMGGPGVRGPIEPEVESLIFTEQEDVDLWPEPEDRGEQRRRSIYLYRKRNVRYPMFDAFDAPDTQTACAVRDVSTHALQSLELINSAFAIERAKGLAGRVLAERSERGGRVERLYRIVLGRAAGPAERERGERFLSESAAALGERSAGALAKPSPCPEGLAPSEGAAWVDLAAAMLNRNEFLYVQ